jgi:hypothetical protein
MSGIGDWLNSAIANITGKTTQEHADSFKSALSLPSDSKVSQALGAAPEPVGQTITGGRRKKTRRGGKKRNTHRR